LGNTHEVEGATMKSLQGQMELFSDETEHRSARGYQNWSKDLILKSFDATGKALVCMAPGMGKTFIMAMLCSLRRFNRILVVCCRKKINDQNQRAIEWYCNHDVEREEADSWASTDFVKRVVIACSASLTAGERGRRFMPDLVIIDECHRMGDELIELVMHYMEQGAKVVGMTGSAFRNRKGWSPLAVFGDPTVNLDLRWGIDEGYLVPVLAKRVTIDSIDYSKAIKGSKIDLEELLSILGYESVQQEQWGAVAKCHQPGRKELAFAVNIRHAEIGADLLGRHGVKCAAYHSKQTLEERRDLMRAFNAGEIDMLVCCYTLSMGFDCPEVSAIHMVACLTSLNEYIQRATRAVRPIGEVIKGKKTAAERREAIAKSRKPFAIIYDYVDVTKAHQLCNAKDLMAPKIRTPKQRMNDGELDGEKPIDLGQVEDDAVALQKEETAQAAREMEQEKERRKNLAASVGVELADCDPYLGAVDGSSKKREARLVFGYWYIEGVKQNLKGLPVRLAPIDFLKHHRKQLHAMGKYKWLLPAIERRINNG
jgi:superfamily II DNA or RNA helicase